MVEENNKKKDKTVLYTVLSIIALLFIISYIAFNLPSNETYTDKTNITNITDIVSIENITVEDNVTLEDNVTELGTLIINETIDE